MWALSKNLSPKIFDILIRTYYAEGNLEEVRNITRDQINISSDWKIDTINILLKVYASLGDDKFMWYIFDHVAELNMANAETFISMVRGCIATNQIARVTGKLQNYFLDTKSPRKTKNTILYCDKPMDPIVFC